MLIRPARASDHDAVWSILSPILRAGEAYALPRDWPREAALGYWFSEGHEVFVAEDAGAVVGCSYIRPNQKGGGAHVANAGFMTAEHATGRGVAGALCADALATARARGYRAMQFNFVVSTNHRAVALWQRFGFETLARLPEAFEHPALGFVDALVMYRRL